jgi:stress-induced morphogen
MELQEMLKQITAAFQSIIQELNLRPTRLDIELTISGYVHVYMTAPEFSGKTSTERDLMIWPALEKKLPDLVLPNISVCILMAPEEEAETLSRLPEHPSNGDGKASTEDNRVDGKLTPHAIFEKITTTFNKIIQGRNIHPTRLDFELTPYETVQIYMEAPEFSGKTSEERDLMIWPALEKRLPEEVIMHIAACVLLAPEDEAAEIQEEKLQAA